MAKSSSRKLPVQFAKLANIDFSLLDFLVRLAVDKDLRQAFDADPAKAMKGFKLSKEAKEAIKGRSSEAVEEVLNVSQQFSKGGGAAAEGLSKNRKAKKK